MAVCLLSPDARTFGFVAIALLTFAMLVVLEVLGVKASVLSVKVRPEIVLLCISLCVGLCLGEVIVRLFFQQLFADWDRMSAGNETVGYEYDRSLGWAPVPRLEKLYDGMNHPYKIINNSKGLRDREPALDSRPGMVVLGDSCVWGCDVDASERFTEKLGARHPDWQVYNFGVVGYGTDQEYLMLQRHMAEFHPQLVLLVVCVQNDERDNCSNGGGRLVYKPYFTKGPKGLQLHGVPVPLSDRVFCLQHPILSKPYLSRLVMMAWGRLRCPVPRYDRSITPALIEEVQEYVHNRQAKFCVALTASSPDLEQFLKSHAIPYVDVSTDRSLTTDAVHWNEKGQTVVANKIEEFLLQEHIFKAGQRP